MADILAPLRSLLTAAEEAISKVMLAAYRMWIGVVREAVLAPYDRFRLPPDPAGIWVATSLWDRRVDLLMQDLRELARHGWADATRDLGVDIPFDDSSPVLADQLQRTRNLMVRTPNEVYRMVLEELAKGGTTQEQARRVSNLLDVTGAENWPARARTVAATEVHRAYAFGGLAAALTAQQTLGPLFKQWDARRDQATRTGHRRANGQKVPASQPFIVSGEALMAPLDPAGSPENVINCRCRAEYSRSR